MAGARAMRQMFINIFELPLPPLIVQASLGFSNAILDKCSWFPRHGRAASSARWFMLDVLRIRAKAPGES